MRELLVLLLLVLSCSLGSILYVDPDNGVAAGTCSEAQPCSSFVYAVSEASDSDTVQIVDERVVHLQGTRVAITQRSLTVQARNSATIDLGDSGQLDASALTTFGDGLVLRNLQLVNGTGSAAVKSGASGFAMTHVQFVNVLTGIEYAGQLPLAEEGAMLTSVYFINSAVGVSMTQGTLTLQGVTFENTAVGVSVTGAFDITAKLLTTIECNTVFSLVASAGVAPSSLTVRDSVFLRGFVAIDLRNANLSHVEITGSQFQDFSVDAAFFSGSYDSINVSDVHFTNSHVAFLGCAPLEFTRCTFVGVASSLSVLDLFPCPVTPVVNVNNSTFTGVGNGVFNFHNSTVRVSGGSFSNNTGPCLRCFYGKLQIDQDVGFANNSISPIFSSSSAASLVQVGSGCNVTILAPVSALLSSNAYPEIACNSGGAIQVPDAASLSAAVSCERNCTFSACRFGLEPGYVALIVIASVAAAAGVVMTVILLIKFIQKKRKRLSYRDLDIQDEL